MNVPSSLGVGRSLMLESFRKAFAEFSGWRIDSFQKQTQQVKGKGVLPFIRGLRLSANLIYIIRELLEGTELEADWGHILDKDGIFCSCECDIIIHKKGCLKEWNGGNRKPIMDFKFIRQEDAVAVVSCKSFMRASDVDKEFGKETKKFVRKVWLFAECCGPKSLQSIRDKAKKAGYSKFWALYAWSRQSDCAPYENEWLSFAGEVEKLKKIRQGFLGERA